jgi:hypothetical protein
MYSRMSWAATSGRVLIGRPAPANAHAPEARFVRENDSQASPAPGGSPPRFPHRIRKAVFFKSILRYQVALGMERTRHQLAPAVSV